MSEVVDLQQEVEAALFALRQREDLPDSPRILPDQSGWRPDAECIGGIHLRALGEQVFTEPRSDIIDQERIAQIQKVAGNTETGTPYWNDELIERTARAVAAQADSVEFVVPKIADASNLLEDDAKISEVVRAVIKEAMARTKEANPSDFDAFEIPRNDRIGYAATQTLLIMSELEAQSERAQWR